MKKSRLIIGIACFVLAAVIFVFAEGGRRLYSGIFFIILGVGMVAGARRT
jgi:hypothetical protein